MKIAVLAKPGGWHFEDLARAANLRGHELVSCPLNRFETTIKCDAEDIRCGDINLKTMDAVVVRAIPAGSLEQIVFRMDLLASLERSGVLVINSPKSVEAAVDKYLSLRLLHESGLRVPETHVCQTREQASNAFRQLGGDVVLKPIFGSEGRGLERIQSQSQADALFAKLLPKIDEHSISNELIGPVFYLQKFIPHFDGHSHRDIRALVIDREVFTMTRENKSSWITNVRQGAKCQGMDGDQSQIRLIAIKASQAVGAKFAGVDLVFDSSESTPSGTKDSREEAPYVIEVNAAPGWKAISSTLDVDVAGTFIEMIERERTP